ncbi:MAG: Rieske (2Fe-2S) protein [Actinomycetota bacterium]
MADWVRVAELKELQRRKKLLVEAGGIPIAVFFDDGYVYALRDICIHKQRNLSKGLVFQGKVICPGHQWAFDLPTGWVDEWAECQPTFAVKVEGGEVFVDPEPRVRTVAPPPEERWPHGRGAGVGA